MPLRETDPGFERELHEKFKAELSPKFGFSQYDSPLPLLLVDVDLYAEKQLLCQEPAEQTTAISAHMSVRIRAFYEQMAAAYNGSKDPLASIGIELTI
jgi:hypothetical protein